MADPTVHTGAKITYDSSTSANFAEFATIMESDIFLFDANQSPITSILKHAKGKSTLFKPGFEFHWPEDEYRPMGVSTAQAHSSGATDILFDNRDPVAIGDVLLFQDDTGFEQVLVTTLHATANTLTVVRGFGGTARAIPDNSFLLNLGHAGTDLGTTPEAKVTQPVERTNYLQVKRTAVDLSGMFEAWKKDYDTGMKYQVPKSIFEHNKFMEMCFILGHKKKYNPASGTTVNYEATYHMGGIWEWMSDYADADHIVNINGSITEDVFWRNIVEPIQPYQTKKSKKIGFFGQKMFNAIRYWSGNKLQYRVSDKVMGLKIYTIADRLLGDLEFIYHPWLDQMTAKEASISESVRKGWGMILDVGHLDFCTGELPVTKGNGDVIKVRDTKILPVGRAANPIREGQEIFSIFGCEIKFPNSHSIFYGIDDYA